MEHIMPYLNSTKDALLALFSITGAFYALAVVGGLSLGTMALPWLLTFLTYRPANLKKRYNADWALVTGGSSGIGFSLCQKLATQGINIVIVAFPNQMLPDAATKLAKEFPNIQVRSVGADLGKESNTYMPALVKATADISVNLVFNNAGYIVTGFFADTPIEKWMANAHCNALACLPITHHFLGRMRAEKRKGCIAFTSR